MTTVPASSLENCANWTASVLYSQVRGMEKWCEKVCRLGICPPSHCQCAVIGLYPNCAGIKSDKMVINMMQKVKNHEGKRKLVGLLDVYLHV